MATIVRVLIVLTLPRPTQALLELARVVVQAIGGDHATFAKPSPSMAQVNAAITALAAAQLATRTRARGTAQVRDDKQNALVALLRQLRNYVQGLADAQPEQAAAIALAAGMRLKAPAGRRQATAALVVRTGEASGAVELVAAGNSGRVANEWQYSVDQKTWQSAPASLQARTSIANLTPGALTWFRHRVITKSGPGEWSQMVSAIVQ